MSNETTSAVTITGVDTPSSARPARGYEAQPSIPQTSGKARVKRIVRDAVLAVAAATTITVTFAAVGDQAHADTLTTAKVRPLNVATATPGPIETPSGKLRCTKPGQYNVTVPVRTTTAYKGTRKAALYLQYRNGEQRAVLIGRASSKATTVPVIGCLSPAQIDGNAGPIYLIAVDVIDGERNLVKVRVSR